jgi:hypothetical protein
MTSTKMNNCNHDPTDEGPLKSGGIRVSAIVITLLMFSPSALAYLDPSTGSMVVSAIVGILASLGLAIKTYWYKIKRFFKRGGAGETSADQSSDS